MTEACRGHYMKVCVKQMKTGFKILKLKQEKRKVKERINEMPLMVFKCPHCEKDFSVQRVHIRQSHKKC